MDLPTYSISMWFSQQEALEEEAGLTAPIAGTGCPPSPSVRDNGLCLPPEVILLEAYLKKEQARNAGVGLSASTGEESLPKRLASTIRFD